MRPRRSSRSSTSCATSRAAGSSATLHSTGASAFFIVVYLHMFRALLYGSYRKPRELLWIVGCFIYLALMAEAFFGYLLPWGQMSYWGAQVIVNLFSTRTVHRRRPRNMDPRRLHDLGRHAEPLLRLPRDRGAAGAAAASVVVHLMALHEVGSNNPDGVEIKDTMDPVTGHPVDGIPFHPYYTVKDLVGVVVFLDIFLDRRLLLARRRRLFHRSEQLHPGRIRCRRRSTSPRSGTSRRITPCCGRCRRS